MPGSSFQGKQIGVGLLSTLPPVTRVLDVGPGHGTWRLWCLMWDLFTDAHWTALEVWQPYVERYNLRRWYDKVVVADAAEVADAYRVAHVTRYFDLAIFGDVVEHLPVDRAVAMVRGIPWRHALISIPLGPYPQEASEGNPHEAHLSTWRARDVCEGLRSPTRGNERRRSRIRRRQRRKADSRGRSACRAWSRLARSRAPASRDTRRRRMRARARRRRRASSVPAGAGARVSALVYDATGWRVVPDDVAPLLA